jgi:hypothetical protein
MRDSSLALAPRQNLDGKMLRHLVNELSGWRLEWLGVAALLWILALAIAGDDLAGSMPWLATAAFLIFCIRMNRRARTRDSDQYRERPPKRLRDR